MELTDLNQTCPGVEVNVLYQKMRNKTPPGGWTWPVCTASTTLLFTIGQRINLGVRNLFTLINNHILLNVYNFCVYEITKSKRILYLNLISSCSRVMTLSYFFFYYFFNILHNFSSTSITVDSIEKKNLKEEPLLFYCIFKVPRFQRKTLLFCQFFFLLFSLLLFSFFFKFFFWNFFEQYEISRFFITYIFVHDFSTGWPLCSFFFL